jgi:hypothetical protein
MNIKDVKTYPAAHAGIVAVSAVIGAVSTCGAAVFVSTLPLPEQTQVPAMVLGGVFAFAVAMMPVLFAPAWANARGFSKVIGLAIALAFCSLDAGTQTGAVLTGERLMKAEAMEVQQDRLKAVQEKLDALPSSYEVCIGHGPQNCASRREGLKDDRKALLDDRELIETELETLEASSLPIAWLAGFLLFVQAATFFGRAFLTSVTERQKDAIRQKRTPGKRKPRAKAKAKPNASPKPVQRELKLVPAND